MFRSSWLVVAVWLCAALAGCGSGTPAGPGSSEHAAANVAGNWLLTGGLPNGLNGSFAGVQLTVTFSTIGNQLMGSGQVFAACQGFGGLGITGPSVFGATYVVAGQVASDGSFTAKPVSGNPAGVAGPSVTISGTVPASAGGAWSGSYAIDTTGEPGCGVQVSNAMAAVAIAPVTGTYKASGGITSGGSQTPITVTMTLTQGVTSTAGGAFQDQAYLLNGTISVEGTACFHTGAVQQATIQGGTVIPGLNGAVFGGSAVPVFKMDDGSLLFIGNQIADTEASKLDPTSAVIDGGTCGGGGKSPSQIALSTFSRQ